MFFDDFFGDDFGDFEIEDFAWVGGAVGCLEEEMNERIRIEREVERELEDNDEINNESPEELY
jgi:hypothetical protein